MTDTELAILNKEMEELKTEVKELSAKVDSLLAAWNTATGFLAVIKWVAGIGAAAAMFWSVWGHR